MVAVHNTPQLAAGIFIFRMQDLAIETDYSDDLVQQMGNDVVYKLTEENRAMVVNPQSRHEIRQGDALFIIAESAPVHL